MIADSVKTTVWAVVRRLYPLSIFLSIAIAMHLPLLVTDFDFYSGDASDLIPFVFGTKLIQYNTFHQLWEIPFWNPYLFLGQPTVGNIQYALFYPLNFFFLVFPFFAALIASQILHFTIAGIGLYLLARRLGCQKTGSLLSGALFMLNGRLLYYIHAGWFGYFCSICWIPLLILAAIDVIERQNRHLMVFFGAVFALTLLAGTPQYAFFGSALFLIHGAFSAIRADIPSSRYRIVYGMLVAGLIGVLLAGVQLLPSIEQTYLSSRVLFDSTHQGFHFSWNPQQWFRLLFRPEILRHDFSWELCAYIGVGGMLLALLGATVRRIPFPFLIIWGGIPLLASMGAAFPPMDILLDITPGLSMLSNPSRYFIFTIVALCISAGFGFEALADGQNPKKKALWLCVAAVFLSFLTYAIPIRGNNTFFPNIKLFVALFFFLFLSTFFLFHTRQSWLKMLLVGWLILDPAVLGHKILTPYDFHEIEPPQKILQTIKDHPPAPRVAVIQPKKLWGTRRTPIDDWTFVQEGLSRVGGYDPLVMRHTLRFLTRLEGTPPVIQNSMWAFRLWAFGNPALFDLSGITHIVSLEKLYTPHLEFMTEDTTTMPDFQGGRWQDTPLYLYKNPGALSRAFFLSDGPAPSRYRLRYHRPSPNAIWLNIETPASGAVVITESFHPGWRASTINGKAIEVKPYMDSFISFQVPAGLSEIYLDFFPDSFRQGLRLTLMGLLLSLFVLLLERRQNRRRIAIT